MNSVKIVLPGERVFSINQTYSRDMRFKTSAFKDWHLRLTTLLEQCSELTALAEKWRKDGGNFEVILSAIYPQHLFFNVAGDISSKTIDCSNFEKVLIDIIFGDVMDVNDKYITTLTSHKKPGATYSIEIEIVSKQEF